MMTILKLLEAPWKKNDKSICKLFGLGALKIL